MSDLLHLGLAAAAGLAAGLGLSRYLKKKAPPNGDALRKELK